MLVAMLPWFSTAAWCTSTVAGRFWEGVHVNSGRAVATVSVPNQSVKSRGSASVHGNCSLHAAIGCLSATSSGCTGFFRVRAGSLKAE